MGALHKLGLYAGTLLACGIIGNCLNKGKSSYEKYSLPAEITVVESSVPVHEREKVWTSTNLEGKVEEKIEKEKYIKTNEIDFSKDFEITTDRYRFVKDDDWLPSRLVGHVFSLPRRLLLFDWDVGWGNDAERTRAALSMLENNKDVKDLTVRVNHNEAFYDLYRIFAEDKLQERNNFLARAVFGNVECSRR